MAWLTPSIIATLAGTIILGLTFFYLYRQEKSRALGLWSIAWAFYALRLVFMLVYIQQGDRIGLLIGNQLCSLIHGVYLLWGAYVFLGRPTPRPWFSAGILCGLLTIAAAALGLDLLWVSLPTFAYLAAVYVWLGLVLLRTRLGPGLGQTLLGWAFIIWGLHKADYPILRGVEWFAPWGYLLGAALALVAAIGMILLYFQRARDELAASRELQAQSESRYRNLVDALPLAVLVHRQGKVIYANPATAGYLGLDSAEEALGRRMDEFIPFEARADLRRRIEESLDEGRDHAPIAHQVRRMDGRLAQVESFSLAIDYQDGPAIMTIGRDVTQLMKAMEERRLSEARLMSILEGLDMVAVLLDRRGRVTYANPYLLALTGYTRDEIQGSPWIEKFIPAGERQELEEVFTKTISEGAFPPYYENPILTRNGSERLIAWNNTALLGPQGEVEAVAGIGLDITDHRRDELALRDSESRLRAILAAAENVSFIITDASDPEPLVLEFSPGAEKIFGYTREEMIGQPVSRLHRPEEVERFPQIHAELREDRAGTRGETILVRRSGETFPALFSTYPLRDAEGKMYAALGVTIDISHQRRLESQLRQAQKMEAIGTLAGGIAHDFNNILGVITGYTELALLDARAAGGKGDPQAETLEQVLKAASRARDLIKQIMTFSRRSEVVLKPLDLNQVLSQAKGLLERTLPKMVSFDLDLDPGLRPIRGDRAQLDQIIMNLASNASDAMPNGGRLVFRTTNLDLDQESRAERPELEPGPYVRLEVRDEGEGMTAEELSQIFDPFFTTKEVGKGTGLGLSTVYGIVKAHGGAVECTSRPGRGTRFVILLPALDQAQAVEPDPRRAERVTAGQGETILVVDDEEPLRLIAQRHLTRQGYRVLTAASGEAALDILHSGDLPDLVVLDLGMPGMGGAAALEEMQAQWPGLPVLVASGYALEGSHERIASLGADGFVAKPFLAADLLGAVREVLDQGSARPEG